MIQFFAEILAEAVIRSAFGIVLGFPTLCGTFVYRLSQGSPLAGAMNSAMKNAGRVFVGCFEG
jgi:hypothetical protein